MEHPPARRAEFDWLRVLALGMLMVFHSALGFSTWTWHVSDPHWSPVLDTFLDFLLRWRVALVFIVSGAALMLALGRRPARIILRERLRRLGIPLLFGMLVVVPPQVYLERVQRGQFRGSYLDFIPHIADGIYPAGNLSWHHLWFMPYVLALSAILLPLFLWARTADTRRRLDPLMQAAAERHLHWLLLIPLAVIQWLLRWQGSDDHTFLTDGHGWLEFAVLMMLGGVLAQWRQVLTAIQNERYILLVVGIASYVSLRGLWPSIGEDPGRLPASESIAWATLSALNLMSWTLAALAFLTRWFRTGSPALTYLTEAALPVYILHQTLIVYAVVHLHHVAWPLGVKIALTLGFAFTVSLAGYEFVIRRSRWLRPLFGVKPRAATIGLEVLLVPLASTLTSRWRAPSS